MFIDILTWTLSFKNQDQFLDICNIVSEVSLPRRVNNSGTGLSFGLS